MDEEIAMVQKYCHETLGVGFAVNEAFAKGGKGAEELAQLVVDTIEQNPSQPIRFAYGLNESIEDKVNHIAKEIYSAGSVTYSSKAFKAIQKINDMGLGHLPVCIAKTQYSFSTDPKAYGDVRGFEMKVGDIVINRGAEMIVVIMGDIMRMPGLPKEPQAVNMDVIDGQIEGLS